MLYEKGSFEYVEDPFANDLILVSLRKTTSIPLLLSFVSRHC
jgi:hypothetical protein